MRSLGRPAAMFVLAYGLALAQVPGDQPKFEVASVKPSSPANGKLTELQGGPETPDPGRITYRYVPLGMVLAKAYDLTYDGLTGPDWLGASRYDITATLPVGTTPRQFEFMLRNLLIERFGMQTHTVMRDFPAYDLVVAKSGPKLKPSAGGPGELKVRFDTSTGAPHLAAEQQTIRALAEWLPRFVGNRPVEEKTGLTGKYDFTLVFSLGGPAPGAEISEPDLFAALQEQLGLKLEQRQVPLPVIIIDHIDQVPTGN